MSFLRTNILEYERTGEDSDGTDIAIAFLGILYYAMFKESKAHMPPYPPAPPSHLRMLYAILR
jgi:hypothetical protein